MSTYVMAVEMGWQGTKTAIYDENLKQVSLAFEEANLITSEPPAIYQYASDILDSAKRTIQRAIGDAQISADDITAVALSGQMGGIMGVDSAGEAATVYDSWLDTRCAKYSDLMRAKAGKKILQINGAAPGFTQGPKILWWKNEKPEEYAKIAKFVTPYAYVGMQMCGLDASGAYYDYTCLHESGFSDNAAGTWSKELLDTFDIPEEKLPKVVSPFDQVGTVTAKFAQESGLKEGTKVFAGAGDAAAAIFGAGFTKSGMVGEFAGALSAITGVCDDYTAATDGEIAMMHSPKEGLWYPMAYTNGSGLAERWFKDTLTGIDQSQYSELDAEAANVAPGSDGVYFVPHFACGASLGSAKGSFVGLDWNVTRAHLYRAMMEGIAYERRQILDDLKRTQSSLDYSSLCVIGGMDRSKLCNQIEADVLGCELQTMQVAEPGLQGTAAIAAQGAGMVPDAAAVMPAPEAGEKFAPASETGKKYDSCLKDYVKLTELLLSFNRN